MRHAKRFETPLGPMLALGDDAAVTGLYFLGQKHFPAGLPEADAAPTPMLDAVAAQLEEYFAGRRRTFALPCRPRGTSFQQSVWEALSSIPYGETASYGEVARRIGRPEAARAVGAAVGRNPLSIIVPCHRVLGTSGRLTGYAGGLDRKQALLALEADSRGGRKERRGEMPPAAGRG